VHIAPVRRIKIIFVDGLVPTVTYARDYPKVTLGILLILKSHNLKDHHRIVQNVTMVRFLCLLISLLSGIFAQPGNDQCTQATPLEINGPTVIGTTVNATTFAGNSCNVFKGHGDVFYNVVGNGEELSVEICYHDPAFIANGNSGRVLKIMGGDCDSFTCVNNQVTRPPGGPPTCENQANRVNWYSEPDVVYTIFVFGSELNFDISLADFTAPPNDKCVNRSPLQLNAPAVAGSTVNATRIDRDNIAAPPTICFEVGTNVGPSVWYSVTGNGRRFNVVVSATFMIVWDGDCGALNCVASQNRGNLLTWSTVPGVEYTIMILHRVLNEAAFDIAVSDLVAPPNDKCPDATELQINGPLLPGTTINATVEDLACDHGSNSLTVWYTVVGIGAELLVSTCGSDGVDSGIQVFSGDCDALFCISGSFGDFGRYCSNDQDAATLTWESVMGTVYYIPVAANIRSTLVMGGDIAISLRDLSENSTLAPTAAPITDAPATAPITDAPATAPVTDAPAMSPVATTAPAMTPVVAPTEAPPSTTTSTPTGDATSAAAAVDTMKSISVVIAVLLAMARVY
jgi:hypothetical protein